MLNHAQECACRAIDKKGRERPMIIVVAAADLDAVRKVVGVSFEAGTPSDGTTWYPKDEEPVSVLRFSDPVPTGSFRVEVCTNGKDLSQSEKDDLARWQKAGAGV